jgi:hypothetical protein
VRFTLCCGDQAVVFLAGADDALASCREGLENIVEVDGDVMVSGNANLDTAAYPFTAVVHGSYFMQ